MNHWRMSFRCGSQGYEMWPHCLKHGIAAISYDSIDDLDLTRHKFGDPPEKWSQLNSSQKASIRRVAYEMRKGDVIYVKQGPFIVGRGKVLGPYKYRLKKELEIESGHDFPHQVPVDWEPTFTRVRVLLGGELITVLKLSEQHLRNLSRNEMRTRKTLKKTEAQEGQLVHATTRFRRRNRALVEAKLLSCASRMHCEVCRFRVRA
jgi:hypothetical protein